MKHAYDSSEAKCGDIILHGSRATGTGGGAGSLINRVVGLPGDEIEIRAWGVYRNGERLDEPYMTGGAAGVESELYTVPEGHYFVLGDNRSGGLDSRDERIGFVAKAEIRGKAVSRLLPVSRAGKIQ